MARQNSTHYVPGAWVLGLTTFAGVVMIWVGIFQFFEGLAAILQGNFYVATPHYLYNINITTWGWIHIILGIIVALAGFFVFAGKLWARILGILMATLSAISNFFFIPHYPLWSILIIALDMGVIWALAVYKTSED